MIGRTALLLVVYHTDKLHQWVEMRREVAHQTNLFERSLGGRSPLRQPLSRSQLSRCITRRSEGFAGANVKLFATRTPAGKKNT